MKKKNPLRDAFGSFKTGIDAQKMKDELRKEWEEDFK